MKLTEKNLSGSTLKIIACISMLIDHTAACILENCIKKLPAAEKLTSPLLTVYDVMRCIGRLAFPIFCFLLVEGFCHTHNRLKYLRNLAVFTLISEIPFNLALFSGNVFYPKYQNVFLTLFFAASYLYLTSLIEKADFSKKIFSPLSCLGALFGGVLVAAFISDTYFGTAFSLYFDATNSTLPGNLLGELLGCVFAVVYIVKSFTLLKEQRIRDALCMLVLILFFYLAKFSCCDYGGAGVLTVALMYSLNKRPNFKPMVIFLFGVLLLSLHSPIEFFALFGMYPIARYNHQRGLKLKYFFYAFYPVHLLLLYLICLVTGLL